MAVMNAESQTSMYMLFVICQQKKIHEYIKDVHCPPTKKKSPTPSLQICQTQFITVTKFMSLCPSCLQIVLHLKFLGEQCFVGLTVLTDCKGIGQHPSLPLGYEHEDKNV